MTKKQDKLIKTEIETLLSKMGFEVDFEIKESDEIIFINLKPKTEKETAMLIGWHGESLEALQHLVRLIILKKTQNYNPLIINIGQWREKQEQILIELAKTIALKVKKTGQAITLKPMPAYKRRLIHLALASDAEIETESIGEGKERKLVIKPKQ